MIRNLLDSIEILFFVILINNWSCSKYSKPLQSNLKRPVSISMYEYVPEKDSNIMPNNAHSMRNIGLNYYTLDHIIIHIETPAAFKLARPVRLRKQIHTNMFAQAAVYLLNTSHATSHIHYNDPNSILLHIIQFEILLTRTQNHKYYTNNIVLDIRHSCIQSVAGCVIRSSIEFVPKFCCCISCSYYAIEPI